MARDRHGLSCHTIQERACSRALCSSAVRGRRWSSLLPGAGSHTHLSAFAANCLVSGTASGASRGSPRLRARYRSMDSHGPGRWFMA